MGDESADIFLQFVCVFVCLFVCLFKMLFHIRGAATVIERSQNPSLKRVPLPRHAQGIRPLDLSLLPIFLGHRRRAADMDSHE